jgi:hypothetical protein
VAALRRLRVWMCVCMRVCVGGGGGGGGRGGVGWWLFVLLCASVSIAREPSFF